MFPNADSGEYLVSIHAAREGGDAASNRTFPCPAVSIHAAREGGDQRTNRLWQFNGGFNPRRP